MSYNNEFMYDGYHGNKKTLRMIQHRCRFSDGDAAKYLHTSIDNYRRWKRQNNVNATAIRLLAIRAGLFPWPDWEGWEMHNGYLFPPGYNKNGFTPNEIMAMIFIKQQASEQKRQINALTKSKISKGNVVQL